MRKGFTLIELMIVIAIIAIIAAIAIPNLLESRIGANESASASSMSTGVKPNETQYQSSGYNDLDSDNIGEYGHLGQLAGSLPTYGTSGTGLPTGELAMLPSAWASADVGEATASPLTNPLSGYHFASYIAVSSATSTGANAGDATKVNNAEKYYTVIGWPEQFGDTGRRGFVLTQDGNVLSAPPVESQVGEAASVAYAAYNITSGEGAVLTTSANRNPVWATYKR